MYFTCESRDLKFHKTTPNPTAHFAPKPFNQVFLSLSNKKNLSQKFSHWQLGHFLKVVVLLWPFLPLPNICTSDTIPSDTSVIYSSLYNICPSNTFLRHNSKPTLPQVTLTQVTRYLIDSSLNNTFLSLTSRNNNYPSDTIPSNTYPTDI